MTAVTHHTRELLPVSSSNPRAVLDALQLALFEQGPAVFSVTPGRVSPAVTIDSNVAVVVETSGSTAAPKRVWHSSESLLASARMVNGVIGWGTWWLALPTHYIAGLQVLTRSLVAETTPVFASPGAVVDSLLEDFLVLESRKAEGPLFTSLVPTQLRQLLDAADVEPRVRQALQLFDRILVGGQAVSADLVSRATAHGATVTKTYGSAETAGGCVWEGVPLEGVGVDIIDGRVALSGPILAGGYLGDLKRTEASFIDRGGTRFFLTDDRGGVVDGKLVIHGRVDQVMISGGVKVDLSEVDSFLRESDHTQEIAVAARPDSVWGEVPVVVSETPLNGEVLRTILVKRFGTALAQVEFVQVDKLPRTDSGKISTPGLLSLLKLESDYPGGS